MRKVIVCLLLAISALTACSDDEPADTTEIEAGASAEASLEAEESPAVEQPDPEEREFVAIDDGVQIPITESCVDNSGTYKGTLPGQGYFILRIGNAPDESLVDFLPSATADPLSSQTGDDTIITDNSTSYVTGTSTVYTEDGANSLNLEFGIIIEDVDPAC